MVLPPPLLLIFNLTIMSALAATAIAAGSAIAGNLIGNASAKQQYKYNLKLQQQAQQYNTREREATQAWNLEQWNRENAYNTPLAQRQRLSEAGYNPYLTQDGSQAGHVQSSPMSSGSNSVGLPDTGRFIAQAGEQIANLLFTRKKVDSEANKNNTDAARNMADVGWIGANRKRIESLLPYEQMQINAYVDNLRADQKYKQELEQLTISQNIAQKLGNEYQRIINKYADEGQQQQLVKLASEISLLCSQYDVNQAQRKELLSRAVKNYAEANFTNINTKIAQKDLDYITQTLDTSIAMTNMENALSTISMSNLFDAEKTFGKNIAWNQAQANMYQARKLKHLSLGSHNFYQPMSPGIANSVEGLLNVGASGLSQTIPIAMWIAGSKLSKPSMRKVGFR